MRNIGIKSMVGLFIVLIGLGFSNVITGQSIMMELEKQFKKLPRKVMESLLENEIKDYLNKTEKNQNISAFKKDMKDFNGKVSRIEKDIEAKIVKNQLSNNLIKKVNTYAHEGAKVIDKQIKQKKDEQHHYVPIKSQ